MAKNTQESWRTDQAEHDAPYQDIKIKVGNRTICTVWIDDAPVPEFNAEQEAYARLIVAAPDMLTELKKLYKAYVNLLESGRDQIVALGGSCDPVDVMEHNDPNLRDTRDFINKVTEGSLEPVGSMGMPLSCGKPLCAPNDHHILCRLYKPQEAVIKPESGL